MHADLLALALMVLSFSAIPPLSDSQLERLSHASDGADHREDAFLALVENVRQWRIDSPADSPPVATDWSAFVNEPAPLRGKLFHFQGMLEQRTALAPPYENVQEWFVRNEHGTPLVVYVTGVDWNLEIPPRATISIIARFFKRMDFVARDGKQRSYAAFVGTSPRILPATQQSDSSAAARSRVWMIAAPVAALLMFFIFLRLALGRRGSRYSVGHRPRITDDAAMADHPEFLPSDPADALAELKRRRS